MASRWTTSGIDWANLDLHKERTSWVIDELYRAFSEKKALYTQMKSDSPSSNVALWDVDAGIRDQEKVYEMLSTFTTWLSQTNPNFFPANNTTFLGWHDYTVDDTGGSYVSNSPFDGVSYFTMSAGGNFETLIGVSLARLRDWGFTGTPPATMFRIDTELLIMIYKILINLTQIMPYNGSGFSGKPNVLSFGVMETRLTLWEGAGVDWTATKADYDSASSTNPVDIDNIQLLLMDAENTVISHYNNYFEFTNLKNSSDVVILPSSVGVYGYKFYQGDSVYYPFTMETFALDSLSGEFIRGYDETHPYAFNTPGGGTNNVQARTILIIPINDMDMIEYYT